MTVVYLNACININNLSIPLFQYNQISVIYTQIQHHPSPWMELPLPHPSQHQSSAGSGCHLLPGMQELGQCWVSFGDSEY